MKIEKIVTFFIEPFDGMWSCEILLILYFDLCAVRFFNERFMEKWVSQDELNLNFLFWCLVMYFIICNNILKLVRHNE